MHKINLVAIFLQKIYDCFFINALFIQDINKGTGPDCTLDEIVCSYHNLFAWRYSYLLLAFRLTIEEYSGLIRQHSFGMSDIRLAVVQMNKPIDI